MLAKFELKDLNLILREKEGFLYPGSGVVLDCIDS